MKYLFSFLLLLIPIIAVAQSNQTDTNTLMQMHKFKVIELSKSATKNDPFVPKNEIKLPPKNSKTYKQAYDEVVKAKKLFIVFVNTPALSKTELTKATRPVYSQYMTYETNKFNNDATPRVLISWPAYNIRCLTITLPVKSLAQEIENTAIQIVNGRQATNRRLGGTPWEYMPQFRGFQGSSSGFRSRGGNCGSGG